MSYKPVPTESAARIATEHSKDVVVIVSWDEASNFVHTTTYGREPRFKQPAAKLGELLTAAAGCDLSKAVDFEDFRNRTESEWPAEREQLQKRIQKLEMAAGTLRESALECSRLSSADHSPEGMGRFHRAVDNLIAVAVRRGDETLK